MSGKKFVCNSCNSTREERSSFVNCRICDDICCTECVNEEGDCVPCVEEKQAGLMGGEAVSI